MAAAIYILCMVTSALCAVLLLRGWGRSRSRLLLWSAACFVLLAINNVLLFVDIIVVPGVDLAYLRHGTSIVALTLLVYGLVFDAG